jgi:hypothetical protein
MATGGPVSDLDQDQIKTQLITKIRWLSPVPSVDDLPVDGVEEGMHCFDEGPEDDGEEEIWAFEEGKWVRVDEL